MPTTKYSPTNLAHNPFVVHTSSQGGRTGWAVSQFHKDATVDPRDRFFEGFNDRSKAQAEEYVGPCNKDWFRAQLQAQRKATRSRQSRIATLVKRIRSDSATLADLIAAH